MSMRANWKINGMRFAQTSTERGGQRYFIDGRPTSREDWRIAFAEAKIIRDQRMADYGRIDMWKCGNPMCGHLNETFFNPIKCCRCGGIDDNAIRQAIRDPRD